MLSRMRALHSEDCEPSPVRIMWKSRGRHSNSSKSSKNLVATTWQIKLRSHRNECTVDRRACGIAMIKRTHENIVFCHTKLLLPYHFINELGARRSDGDTENTHILLSLSSAETRPTSAGSVDRLRAHDRRYRSNAKSSTHYFLRNYDFSFFSDLLKSLSSF